jgi:hypothetical protein
METTNRLALPLLASGQAAKEIAHNESLFALDVLVSGAVEEPPRNAPPASPVAGQAWIVGSSPSGIWAGKAGQVAGYTTGGWRLIAPVDGMNFLVKSTGTFAIRSAGAWKVGAQAAAAIPDPAGGTTVDSEARTAIAAILAALRSHGIITT